VSREERLHADPANLEWVSTDRELARLALSLVEGTMRGDATADELLAEGFTDSAEAARAHAYLSGFVIQTLATARGETPAQTCGHLRALLS
jgi:hypothetical protein